MDLVTIILPHKCDNGSRGNEVEVRWNRPGDTSKIEQPEQVQSRELANEALYVFFILGSHGLGLPRSHCLIIDSVAITLKMFRK